jgi:hypothetical protein
MMNEQMAPRLPDRDDGRLLNCAGISMSPEPLQSLLALLFGFAVAGLLTTGYRVVTRQPASFRLLERGPKPSTFAAVPFLAFAAPFIIIYATLQASSYTPRCRRHHIRHAAGVGRSTSTR